MDHEQVVALLVSHQKLSTAHLDLTTRVAELTRQLAWFKQQMFREKSERRFVDRKSSPFPVRPHRFEGLRLDAVG